MLGTVQSAVRRRESWWWFTTFEELGTILCKKKLKKLWNFDVEKQAKEAKAPTLTEGKVQEP